MKTLSLRKQAQLAPKFVLSVDGLNLFLAEKQGLTGCNLTENISEAQKFSIGFDDPETKTGVWSILLQKELNNKFANFIAIHV